MAPYNPLSWPSKPCPCNTSTLHGCQPTPILTFPPLSESCCNDWHSGWSDTSSCQKDVLHSKPLAGSETHPLVVLTYQPCALLLLMMCHVPVLCPRTFNINAWNSITHK